MGYNVQVAVDTTHHLIITHEVNVVTDRSQLSSVAKQPRRRFKRRTSMRSLTGATSAAMNQIEICGYKVAELKLAGL